MALTLTISDNADGTGAVATVAGSSGGSVTINRASVTASAIGSYAPAGSRTGDGTVSVSGTGYYYWQAVEGSTSSTATYKPTTTDGDSVWNRCVTMIADRIKAIPLTTIGSSSVFDKVLNDLDTNVPPCVVVSPTGESERPYGGPIAHDDTGYPIAVMLVEDVTDNVEASRGRFFKWRERIHRVLENQIFDLRVPEVWNVAIEPAPAIATGEIKENRIRMGLLTAVCIARMARG